MENNSCTNIQELMTFSNATFLDQQLDLSSEQITNLQSKDHPNPFSLVQSLEASPFSTSYDREQAETVPISECLEDFSPPFSATGFAAKNKSLVGNKRKRNNNRFGVEEKPKEVVLVRAKRGQATDSHSLAERVRRGKINEKLRCLRDLVPGCYKAMGMAVMLDVIIDYVQSLQHQIEFLSMKLTAASVHFDFNTSEMDETETLQRNTGTCEVQEMEKMEEGFGGYPYFNPTWPLQ